MVAMTASARFLLKPPFTGYQFDRAYDEMFEAPGVPRPHYQALYRTLLELPPEELRSGQQAADQSFLHQGITFTVYGNKEGTERIFPNDLLPRIIPSHEWQQIERGLTQRITALNLFLDDVYHDQKVLKDKIVPPQLILGAKHFRREFMNFTVPRGIYVHICGTDLIRDHAGNYLVLEDNLRCPSGASYMIENRSAMRRASSPIFSHRAARDFRAIRQANPSYS